MPKAKKMTDAVIVDKTEKSSQIFGITMQCNNEKNQLKNVWCCSIIFSYGVCKLK